MAVITVPCLFIPMKKIRTVRTGIEYVNRLFLNAQWSWKNAMLDVITDEKEPDIWNQWNKERDVLYEKNVCNAKKTDLLLKEDYPGWLYADGSYGMSTAFNTVLLILTAIAGIFVVKMMSKKEVQQ